MEPLADAGLVKDFACGTGAAKESSDPRVDVSRSVRV